MIEREHGRVDVTAHQTMTVPHPAKLRVADFLTLSRAGAFEAYARAELIEGEIWVVNAIHTRHAGAHYRLSLALGDALKSARAGGPAAGLTGFMCPSTLLSDLSLPEPDLVVAERHDERNPLPLSHVRIAIEVSDATLDTDLGRKAQLYARHDVPEYWVVDLDGRVVHQMWSPSANGYGERREAALGERVEAVTIGGLQVDTSDI